MEKKWHCNFGNASEFFGGGCIGGFFFDCLFYSFSKLSRYIRDIFTNIKETYRFHFRFSAPWIGPHGYCLIADITHAYILSRVCWFQPTRNMNVHFHKHAPSLNACDKVNYICPWSVCPNHFKVWSALPSTVQATRTSDIWWSSLEKQVPTQPASMYGWQAGSTHPTGMLSGSD